MKVAVWDTYVTRKDGKLMHFDILVEDGASNAEQVFEYGKKYLKNVLQDGQPLTSEECNFCHIAVAPANVEKQIKRDGYSILEMENCY